MNYTLINPDTLLRIEVEPAEKTNYYWSEAVYTLFGLIKWKPKGFYDSLLDRGTGWKQLPFNMFLDKNWAYYKPCVVFFYPNKCHRKYFDTYDKALAYAKAYRCELTDKPLQELP